MYSEYVLYSLNKTKKIMHQYIDLQLKKEGFDDLVSVYSDIITVLFLNDGQLKMNEISDLVGKDKSTITVLINRLVEKNYVIKSQSSKDKRVYYVNLTEKTLVHRNAFDKMCLAVKEIAFKGFSDKEKEQFKLGMKKIEDNFIKARERELNEK